MPRNAANSICRTMDVEASVLAPTRREAATMLPALASRRIVFFSNEEVGLEYVDNANR